MDGFTSDNGIFVAGGAFDPQGNLNFGTPTAVAENMYTGTPVLFEDAPDFAVNTTPGSNGYGNLYITWTQFYPAGQFPGDANSTDGSDVMVAVSTNGGAELDDGTARTRVESKSALFETPTPGSWIRATPAAAFPASRKLRCGPAGGRLCLRLRRRRFLGLPLLRRRPNLHAARLRQRVGLPFGSGLTQPNSSLFTDAFRTLPVRDIVADPSHPGRVYAVDAASVTDANPEIRGLVDAGTIVFAVSNDNGLTWQNMFTVGANATNFADLSPADQRAFFPF